MPGSVYFSLNFTLEALTKEHDLETDTLKCIFLDTVYALDLSAHNVLGDISANEIAQINGYTGAITLTGVAVTKDSVNHKIDIAADDVSVTASGGSLEAIGAVAIYNDTHASKTLVCIIVFSDSYLTADGKVFQLALSSGFTNAQNQLAEPTSGGE